MRLAAANQGANFHGMKYRLLKGQRVDLSPLPKEDLQFLLNLSRRAMEDEEYFSLAKDVNGPYAYALKGGRWVTKEIHGSLLYRVAEDIADRVAIRQGGMSPDPGDEGAVVEKLVGITEAARQLGISRVAVLKAARIGRLQGRKIGNAWALLRRSVDRYQVAKHRVAAGRQRGAAGRRVATAKRQDHR